MIPDNATEWEYEEGKYAYSYEKGFIFCPEDSVIDLS